MPAIEQGTGQAAAADALERAGLEASFGRAFSETVPVGAVVMTDPGPGERVVSGGTVRVDLSKGPERFEVPDVAGSTPDQAARIIDDQPLELKGQIDAYHPNVALGLVIRTMPSSGERVPRDAEITLVVSKGPPPVDVPAVEGLTVDEAKAALTRVGFVPIVDPEEWSDTVPAGSVIRQSDLGAQGFAGDGVHIVPSKGPELFEVPNVVGKQQAEAEQILTALGFVVDFTYPPWGAVFDTVAGQDADPGTMLPRGTTITLQIV
jgi:serine/threonine-protein kinase